MPMKIHRIPAAALIMENCMEPVGLNVTEAAKVLGVARHTLSRVLNRHAAFLPLRDA